MEALLQGVEVEPVLGDDHDLAVDHAPLGQRALQQVDQLGEVAGERPVVARPELELVAVAEHDAAEAVPLRLVEQARRRAGTACTALASIGFTGGITGRSTVRRVPSVPQN